MIDSSIYLTNFTNLSKIAFFEIFIAIASFGEDETLSSLMILFTYFFFWAVIVTRSVENSPTVVLFKIIPIWK